MLVVPEEEGSIADDRPTERAAHLLATVVGCRLVAGSKSVARVESASPEEAVQCAVKVVGSRLRHHVDLRRRITSKGSVVSIGEHFEFANRIDGRAHAGRVEFRINVIEAVEQEALGVFSDRKSTRLNSSHLVISY